MFCFLTTLTYLVLFPVDQCNSTVLHLESVGSYGTPVAAVVSLSVQQPLNPPEPKHPTKLLYIVS